MVRVSGFLRLILAVTFLVVSVFAKDMPPPIDWPANAPILHFEITKVDRGNSFGTQSIFNIDVAAKNVSATRITNATFRLYLNDKHKIRIGDGWMSLSNVHPGETVKISVTAQTIGTPAEFSIVAEKLPEELAYLAPPKLISTTVYSVPSGAKLSIDGKPVGDTPIAVKLAVGSHVLSFEKEGFAAGTFPMSVAPDQLPGGSVSFELGGSQKDTVELRDGTVVTGDLQYINGTEVVVQVGGNLQKYSRNLVKKVILIEREIPEQAN